jgi:hypothetical protein
MRIAAIVRFSSTAAGRARCIAQGMIGLDATRGHRANDLFRPGQMPIRL